MQRFVQISLMIAVIGSFAVSAFAQDKPGSEKKTPAGTPAKNEARAVVPFYGNTICPVCDNKIDKTLFAEKNGERIYVCQKAGIAKVEADWDGHYAKAYPAAKVKDVKNVKCPMMPRKRGKARFAVTFQGHKLLLCCKKCKRNFKKQPRKWLTLGLNKDLVDLKNANCLVMSGKQTKADQFVIFEGHLVGTCCPKCVDMINKDPAKFAKTLKPKGKKDKSAPKGKTPKKSDVKG